MNIDVLFGITKTLLEVTGQHEDALGMYVKDIQMHPNQPDYVVKYGEKLLECGKVAEGEKVISEALKIFTNNDRLYWVQAMALERLGQFAQAKVSMQKAIRIKGQASYYADYGRILAELQQPRQAEQSFMKALKLEPKQANHYNTYATFLSSQGQTEKAIKQLEQAIRLDAQPSFYFNQAENHTQLGQYTKAYELYRKCIALCPNHGCYLAGFAQALAKNKQEEKADRIWKEAVRVDDQDLTTLNNYGLFLTGLRRYHEAKTMFQQALHVNDTDTEIYINYGHLLYEMGEYEDAKQLYQAGIDKKIVSGMLYSNYAILLNKLGEIDRANVYYLKAIQMEPDNPVYYSNYSVFLMGSGRIPEAKHYLSKSLQIDQANPLTLYNYSCLEYEEGNIDGAVSVLRKCIALDEERNPLYLVSAAVCLFKQGVYDEAAKYYNKAQKITQTNNPQNFNITHRHWNSIKLALETFGQLIHTHDKMQKNITTPSTQEKQIHSLTNEALDSIQHMIMKARDQAKQEERNRLQGQIQTLMNRLEQVEAKLQCLDEQVHHIKEELKWDREFNQKLAKLKMNSQHRSFGYGKNMCWILCTTIYSYRSLKIGVLGKGKTLNKSKMGHYADKVSKILGKGSDIPLVGRFCGIISKVVGVYVELEEEAVIDKIVSSTKDLHSEQLLSRAVTESVLGLLQSDSHILMLEEEKKEINTFEKLTKKKQQLIHKILQIKFQQNQEKQALIDASLIISHLIQEQTESSNPLLTASQSMLSHKMSKNPEEGNEVLTQKILRNQEIVHFPAVDHRKGCCSECELM